MADYVSAYTGAEFENAVDAWDDTAGSTGIVAKTGDANSAVRTVTGTTDEIEVTNGDGVSGNPTLSLATAVTDSLALADSAVQPDDPISINAQTGTSYTLVLGDAGKYVTMDNASPNTLTIPTNASVAFPVGTVINVLMLGAGTTTIAGDTGVTVNGVSAGSGDIQTQYQGVSLLKIATDTWIVAGDIGTVA